MPCQPHQRPGRRSSVSRGALWPLPRAQRQVTRVPVRGVPSDWGHTHATLHQFHHRIPRVLLPKSRAPPFSPSCLFQSPLNSCFEEIHLLFIQQTLAEHLLCARPCSRTRDLAVRQARAVEARSCPGTTPLCRVLPGGQDARPLQSTLSSRISPM